MSMYLRQAFRERFGDPLELLRVRNQNRIIGNYVESEWNFLLTGYDTMRI